MTRRSYLLLLAASTLARTRAATPAGPSLRGKLTRTKDNKPAIETPDHKLVALSGDEATTGVLNDQRLWNTDFEAAGHFTSSDKFEVDPIHTTAMFVHKDGKRLIITYWCDVCYIRTYTPGICVCCQKYTDLDLRDPNQP